MHKWLLAAALAFLGLATLPIACGDDEDTGEGESEAESESEAEAG